MDKRFIAALIAKAHGHMEAVSDVESVMQNGRLGSAFNEQFLTSKWSRLERGDYKNNV